MKTVGATAASMILGPRLGGLIGVLDILKGAVPNGYTISDGCDPNGINDEENGGQAGCIPGRKKPG